MRTWLAPARVLVPLLCSRSGWRGEGAGDGAGAAAVPQPRGPDTALMAPGVGVQAGA